MAGQEKVGEVAQLEEALSDMVERVEKLPSSDKGKTAIAAIQAVLQRLEQEPEGAKVIAKLALRGLGHIQKEGKEISVTSPSAGPEKMLNQVKNLMDKLGTQLDIEKQMAAKQQSSSSPQADNVQNLKDRLLAIEKRLEREPPSSEKASVVETVQSISKNLKEMAQKGEEKFSSVDFENLTTIKDNLEIMEEMLFSEKSVAAEQKDASAPGEEVLGTLTSSLNEWKQGGGGKADMNAIYDSREAERGLSRIPPPPPPLAGAAIRQTRQERKAADEVISYLSKAHEVLDKKVQTQAYGYLEKARGLLADVPAAHKEALEKLVTTGEEGLKKIESYSKANKKGAASDVKEDLGKGVTKIREVLKKERVEAQKTRSYIEKAQSALKNNAPQAKDYLNKAQQHWNGVSAAEKETLQNTINLARKKVTEVDIASAVERSATEKAQFAKLGKQVAQEGTQLMRKGAQAAIGEALGKKPPLSFSGGASKMWSKGSKAVSQATLGGKAAFQKGGAVYEGGKTVKERGKAAYEASKPAFQKGGAVYEGSKTVGKGVAAVAAVPFLPFVGIAAIVARSAEALKARLEKRADKKKHGQPYREQREQSKAEQREQREQSKAEQKADWQENQLKQALQALQDLQGQDPKLVAKEDHDKAIQKLEAKIQALEAKRGVDPAMQSQSKSGVNDAIWGVLTEELKAQNPEKGVVVKELEGGGVQLIVAAAKGKPLHGYEIRATGIPGEININVIGSDHKATLSSKAALLVGGCILLGKHTDCKNLEIVSNNPELNVAIQGYVTAARGTGLVKEAGQFLIEVPMLDDTRTKAAAGVNTPVSEQDVAAFIGKLEAATYQGPAVPKADNLGSALTGQKQPEEGSSPNRPPKVGK